VDGLAGFTLRDTHLYEPLIIRNCSKVFLSNVHIRADVEEAPDFLDIWRPMGHAYQGAIRLENVDTAVIEHCDLRGNQVGLAAFHCRELHVETCDASYNSAFGFWLHDVEHSKFKGNRADFCCRVGDGHLGADSAGFVLVAGSSNNMFTQNKARAGGDGFFVSGLAHTGEWKPCVNNYFAHNDVSYSPNNGFEFTFSYHATFGDNQVLGCNYGFWFGFASNVHLIDNMVQKCGKAGVAAENSCGFALRENAILDNPYGLLLWSRWYPQWADRFPLLRTIYNWRSFDNIFTRNQMDIRVSTDRDHGIHPVPAEFCGKPGTVPFDNQFEDPGAAVRFIVE